MVHRPPGTYAFLCRPDDSEIKNEKDFAYCISMIERNNEEEVSAVVFFCPLHLSVQCFQRLVG